MATDTIQKKWIRVLFILVASFIVSSCMVLSTLQRNILFPLTNGDAPAISNERLNQAGIEQWWLNTQEPVEAWLVPTETTAPAPAVIFAHGNGELIDMWPEPLRPFTNMGYHVLLVEYPGYGRSKGIPDLDTVTGVMVAAYDQLISDDRIDQNNIIGFGRSLGGGAITALARKRELRALIMASTFTSVKDMARHFMMPGFLVPDHFDSLSFIENYKNPVLVIHGSQDELVPYSHGQQLAKAAARGKLITYSAGHNNCPPDWQDFWKELTLFLKHI